MKSNKENITIWPKSGRMAIGEYEGSQDRFAIIQFEDEFHTIDVKFRTKELIRFRDHLTKLIDHFAELDDDDGYIIVD